MREERKKKKEKSDTCILKYWWFVSRLFPSLQVEWIIRYRKVEIGAALLCLQRLFSPKSSSGKWNRQTIMRRWIGYTQQTAAKASVYRFSRLNTGFKYRQGSVWAAQAEAPSSPFSFSLSSPTLSSFHFGMSSELDPGRKAGYEIQQEAKRWQLSAPSHP